jgi:hypothetical protein
MSRAIGMELQQVMGQQFSVRDQELSSASTVCSDGMEMQRSW